MGHDTCSDKTACGADSVSPPVQETVSVEVNTCIAPDVWRMQVRAPGIAGRTQPGQFVHVRVPGLLHRLLRRPFSICDARPAEGSLTIVYKVVGEGTRALSGIAAGAQLDVIGPLGRGFTIPSEDVRAVIVAGGYGAAATYLLARRSPRPPVALVGGRTRKDLLLLQEFRDLGCEVRTSTEDGSHGRRGMVTDLLEELLSEPDPQPRTVNIAACGPTPMLKAVAGIARRYGVAAEVSLDEHMCCGVGACFTCVARVRSEHSESGWEYVRTCLDGPVFPAERIVWD